MYEPLPRLAKEVKSSSTAHCFKVVEPGESPVLGSSSIGSLWDVGSISLDEVMSVSGKVSWGDLSFKLSLGFVALVFCSHVLAVSIAALVRLMEIDLGNISIGATPLPITPELTSRTNVFLHVEVDMWTMNKAVSKTSEGC
jgi:hypothetical protein